MDVDDVDKRLIAELYSNFRDPVTRIARDADVRVEQARYRLNKYEDESLIESYIPIFDHGRLGFNFVALAWLRETPLERLEDHRFVVSAASCLTSYESMGQFVFRSMEELRDSIACHPCDVFMITTAELYPLKCFGASRKDTFSVHPSRPRADVDETDWTIMRCLDNDGRVKAVRIAEELGVSSEAVLYRLNKLREHDVLQGLRLQFNYEAVGLSQAQLLFDLHSNEEDFLRFCRGSRFVDVAALGFGSHNAYVQLFYEDMEDLRRIVGDLGDACDVRSSTLVPLGDELAARGLPRTAYGDSH